jgi:hypothetical protein
MSKRQLYAPEDVRPFAPQPKRIHLGSSSSVGDYHTSADALTNSLEFGDGTDFSADLPDIDFSYHLPHDLQLPDTSLPVNNEPLVVPANPVDRPDTTPSALLARIEQRTAEHLATLIFQHYGSDLGRLLSSLPVAQSAPVQVNPLPDPTRHDHAVQPFETIPEHAHANLPPSTAPRVLGSISTPPISNSLNCQHPLAIPVSLSTPASLANPSPPSPSTASTSSRSFSNTPTPLPPNPALCTKSKSTSVTWWERFRQVPPNRLHMTSVDVSSLRYTILSAVSSMRTNHPLVFGATDAHNTFGALIRTVWTPSFSLSVLQIAICIILSIALPPSPSASFDLPKHAMHRDERPDTWAPYSRSLRASWQSGTVSKMRSIDFSFLHAKYAPHLPGVPPKDFEKRLRDLIRYGGCYMFIAHHLGLGALVELRARLVPDSKHMWGCTKGSTKPDSLTSQACAGALDWLKAKGVGRGGVMEEHVQQRGHAGNSSQAEPKALMHHVLWALGGLFEGFERRTGDGDFPGFEG